MSAALFVYSALFIFSGAWNSRRHLTGGRAIPLIARGECIRIRKRYAAQFYSPFLDRDRLQNNARSRARAGCDVRPSRT